MTSRCTARPGPHWAEIHGVGARRRWPEPRASSAPPDEESAHRACCVARGPPNPVRPEPAANAGSGIPWACKRAPSQCCSRCNEEWLDLRFRGSVAQAGSSPISVTLVDSRTPQDLYHVWQRLSIVGSRFLGGSRPSANSEGNRDARRRQRGETFAAGHFTVNDDKASVTSLAHVESLQGAFSFAASIALYPWPTGPTDIDQFGATEDSPCFSFAVLDTTAAGGIYRQPPL